MRLERISLVNRLFFFKIIFYWLCYYSCPSFPPLVPLYPSPPLQSYRQSPHLCSCPWVMCVSSLASPFPILYFISPWLFCNYQFVLLNTLTSSPILTHPTPIWQPSEVQGCRGLTEACCACLGGFRKLRSVKLDQPLYGKITVKSWMGL